MLNESVNCSLRSGYVRVYGVNSSPIIKTVVRRMRCFINFVG